MEFENAKTGSSDPGKVPTDIKYHRRSRILELVYRDNSSLNLSAEYLRVYSPSAEVRGHGTGQEVLQTGKKDVAIVSIEPRGNYAIQISFDDKHDTGIYRWDYLYELGEKEEEYWADYLQRLADAGKHRDPEVQAVKIVTGTFDPSTGKPSGMGGGGCKGK